MVADLKGLVLFLFLDFCFKSVQMAENETTTFEPSPLTCTTFYTVQSMAKNRDFNFHQLLGICFPEGAVGQLREIQC